MISFFSPNEKKIRDIISDIKEKSLTPYTYQEVGATATLLTGQAVQNIKPRGMVLDHNRRLLGKGEAVFAAARQALENWKMFELGWVRAFPTETPINPREVVAPIARVFGVYFTNFSRIVYTIDDSLDSDTGNIRRFGFAYGTLPRHVESGEERFLIEWNLDSDEVFFDLLAFSRPNKWYVRLAYPLARILQKRFARDSKNVMAKAVQETLE